jgi:hypothetical protein
LGEFMEGFFRVFAMGITHTVLANDIVQGRAA